MRGKFSSGKEYHLLISEMKSTNEDCKCSPFYEESDIDSDLPEYVIDKFILEINGADLYVPKIYWFGLSEIKRVQIFEKNSKIMVSIESGDGAYSEIAEFYFVDLFFKEKIVRQAEFKDNILEHVILNPYK